MNCPHCGGDVTHLIAQKTNTIPQQSVRDWLITRPEVIRGGATVRKSEVYRAYAVWAEMNLRYIAAQSTFGVIFLSMVAGTRSVQTRRENTRVMAYKFPLPRLAEWMSNPQEPVSADGHTPIKRGRPARTPMVKIRSIRKELGSDLLEDI